MKVWRIKIWPHGNMPAVSAALSGVAGVFARVFSWQVLGAALLGIMLARWAWALFAPASPAMPPASWEAAGDAERLFGTASIADAQAQAPQGNIKLIGVFAHRTQGFAVMQVDDKQIGVAQGEEFRPGLRLVETHPDHVVLEQGGVRRRVDLSGPVAQGVAADVPAPGMQAPMAAPPHLDSGAAWPQAATGPSGAAMAPGSLSSTPEQIQALQQQLDSSNNLPPETREAIRHRIEQMKGPSR